MYIYYNTATNPDDTITNDPYCDDLNPKEKGKQALYRRFQVEEKHENNKAYDSDSDIDEHGDELPFVKVSNKSTLASIM